MKSIWFLLAENRFIGETNKREENEKQQTIIDKNP